MHGYHGESCFDFNSLSYLQVPLVSCWCSNGLILPFSGNGDCISSVLFQNPLKRLKYFFCFTWLLVTTPGRKQYCLLLLNMAKSSGNAQSIFFFFAGLHKLFLSWRLRMRNCGSQLSSIGQFAVDYEKLKARFSCMPQNSTLYGLFIPHNEIQVNPLDGPCSSI